MMKYTYTEAFFIGHCVAVAKHNVGVTSWPGDVDDDEEETDDHDEPGREVAEAGQAFAAAPATAKAWLDAGVDGSSAAATPAEASTRGGGAGICRTTGRTQLSNPYINVSRPPPNIADPSTWLTFTLPESSQRR